MEKKTRKNALIEMQKEEWWKNVMTMERRSEGRRERKEEEVRKSNVNYWRARHMNRKRRRKNAWVVDLA